MGPVRSPVGRRLAFVHFSYPPVIGGVETVLRAHARLLRERGHEVRVFCGRGDSDAQASVELVPELAPDHPLGAEMRAELAAGAPGVAFAELQRRLATYFTTRLRDFDVALLHNVLTMPFHLAATAALWAWAESRPPVRIVHWIHDLATLNPDYAAGIRPGFPWDLLRTPASGVREVAVSASRREEWFTLSGRDAAVIPNGVEPREILALTPRVAALLARFAWLEREPILFHPTRVLRRKNIELGLAVATALRAAGHTPLYLVSGAPEPHHPASAAYGAQIRAQAQENADAVFVRDHFEPDESDIAALYRASDALFYPSRQEGFGLPIFEAALNRLPIVCADLAPLRELAGEGAVLIDPDGDPAEVAGRVMTALGADSAVRLRRHARRHAWDRIAADHLFPLVED